MQTFLPYVDFAKSAEVLDRQRLGKQRVETKQLINALTGGSKGWRNHPAAKMWAGHEHLLCVYGEVVCAVWLGRGYKDSLRPWFMEQKQRFPNTGWPSWLGNEDFHRSHRSNLLRKDPVHYGRYFTDVTPDLPYVWPNP